MQSDVMMGAGTGSLVEKRTDALFAVALGLPSLVYWVLLVYAAWLAGGWPAAAFATALIPTAVTFALSMAKASGRCDRMEEGLADG